MKTLVLLILSSIVLACNANKSVSKDANSSINSACPEDGTCTFEVLKNKNFNMKEDNFGNPYSELVDGDKTVLKFEYIRNTSSDDSIQDDQYSEVVYLEVDNNLSATELKDNDLSSVNAGFARICFCKGQTGTYPIKKGTLKISNIDSNTYQLDFSFTVSEVPQIINLVNETFQL